MTPKRKAVGALAPTLMPLSPEPLDLYGEEGSRSHHTNPVAAHQTKGSSPRSADRADGSRNP